MLKKDEMIIVISLSLDGKCTNNYSDKNIIIILLDFTRNIVSTRIPVVLKFQ